MGEHSGPLGRNSLKIGTVENFLVSAQKRECFSAIMHHIHGGGVYGGMGGCGCVGVWGV
jgi:hypothetical protein